LKSEVESGQEKKRKIEKVSESTEEVISQPSKKIKTEVNISTDNQKSLQKSLEFPISAHSEQKLQSQLRTLFCAVVDACKYVVFSVSQLIQCCCCCCCCCCCLQYF
jgi:hypothetical protein